MTKDDIIRMAREAGFLVDEFRLVILSKTNPHGFHAEVERFAALVAAHEREACAKLLDKDTDLSGLSSDPALQHYTATLLSEFAEAIRARKQA